MDRPLPRFAFTQHHEGIVSEIHTKVHVRAYALESSAGAPLLLTETMALWDSGASHSSISDRLASKLGLKAVSRGLVIHSGGSHYRNIYLIDILLPKAPSTLRLPVSEFIAPEEFDFILGMDIITLGDFAITNYGGQTSCSFCIPPRARLDFDLLPPSPSGFSDAVMAEGG